MSEISINNKLPIYTITLLQNLEAYVGTPLYFYGSVQRPDYIQNKSDIDIDIFTMDKPSMALKVGAFLSTSGTTTEKKGLYYLNRDSIVVESIKIKYKHNVRPIHLDISVYNLRDKTHIVQYHKSKINLPLYISTPLFVIKYLFYKLGILPKWFFLACKTFIINLSAGSQNNAQYLIL
jgi:hypothetical protein